MRKTKVLALFVLPLFLAAFLQSQSLADLAKKEKERRAAMKGKGGTVVTTADLAKVKRQPAVEAAAQEQTAEEAAAQAGQADPATAAGAENAKPEAEKPAEETPPGVDKPMSEKDFQAKLAEMADVCKEKQEMIELLTLKLNALYQEFHNTESVKSREIMQQQISDTYDKLLKAETDAQKATKDLEEFTTKTKREKVPEIWIR
jgi:hypothetical protein